MNNTTLRVRRSRLRLLASLFCVSLLGACSIEVDDDGEDDLSRRIGSDYVAVGGEVKLTDAVAGDAFLAGGQVSIGAEIDGDLVVAGGDLSIGGRVGEDVYAAGGDVQLDAIVNGNARVAGGAVTVGAATVIVGATSLTGGRVSFDGDTHGYLHASGDNVRIGGTVHGDVEVRARELHLAPGTRIGGKLIHYGPERARIPADAVIGGGVEYHESSVGRGWESAGNELRTASNWFGRALLFLGTFVAGAAFTLLFPSFSARAAALIGQQPLLTGVLGFAILVCAPVLLVLLLVTVIGIPLALLLLPLYVLLLLLGWITAAVFLSQRALQAFGGNRVPTPALRLATLLLALVALWLLRGLPVVGGVLGFVALLVGIGGLAYAVWNQRQRGVA